MGTKKERPFIMKVLYVGCYRDGTGWGQAAIDYILAMDLAGIDVVPRPIKLNSRNHQPPKRILELEAKSSSGADICIQHTLPHLMDYSNKFKKNIALYATETDSFVDSGWSRKINMMDEAWVINNQMVESSKKSGVNIPIKVVPHASDVKKFYKKYDKLTLPQAEENFVFYTIADLNKRKNLESFIRAFHTEFEPSEPVSILIKSSKYGMAAEDTAKNIKDICNKVKSGIKKFISLDAYKEDLIIADFINDEAICGIHESCDCFVMPSYGEAWCIPAFDAMGFGNTPICTNVGGMADFVGHAGFLIEGRLEPVRDMTETFADLFTGNENWLSIDELELMKVMRHVYENKDELSRMRQEGLEQAQKYCHKNIGDLMKGLLDA